MWSELSLSYEDRSNTCCSPGIPELEVHACPRLLWLASVHFVSWRTTVWVTDSVFIFYVICLWLQIPTFILFLFTQVDLIALISHYKHLISPWRVTCICRSMWNYCQVYIYRTETAGPSSCPRNSQFCVFILLLIIFLKATASQLLSYLWLNRDFKCA